MNQGIDDYGEGTVINLTVSQLKEFAFKVVEEYRTSHQSVSPKYLFNNKSLQEYLGVNHRLLAKYRNDGYLGYSQIGEKFFYTMEDVERLLRSNYYEAYRLKQ